MGRNRPEDCVVPVVHSSAEGAFVALPCTLVPPHSFEGGWSSSR